MSPSVESTIVAARSPKQRDLVVFRQITELVRSGRHRSADGIGDILELRRPMNRGGKRRYDESLILAVLEEWESSEAIRRAPPLKQGGRRYGPRPMAT